MRYTVEQLDAMPVGTVLQKHKSGKLIQTWTKFRSNWPKEYSEWLYHDHRENYCRSEKAVKYVDAKPAACYNFTHIATPAPIQAEQPASSGECAACEGTGVKCCNICGFQCSQHANPLCPKCNGTGGNHDNP